jgi:hypothetical protein
MATANALVRPQLNGAWPVDSLLEAISHYQELIKRKEPALLFRRSALTLPETQVSASGKISKLHQHIAFV